MKGLIAAGLLLIVAPVLTLGLLAGSYAASTSLESPCSPTDKAEPIPGDDASCGQAGDQGAATAFLGPDGYVDDPTSTGQITRRMLHTYQEVQRAFGGWPWGIGCWDPHAWNPTSDHPRGRACDFTVGTLGRFPGEAQRATGWQLARWAQTNAAALGISYIIWDGRIWSPTRPSEGWRTYSGGGIYDTTSPTGGHYDHLHTSVAA